MDGKLAKGPMETVKKKYRLVGSGHYLVVASQNKWQLLTEALQTTR